MRADEETGLLDEGPARGARDPVRDVVQIVTVMMPSMLSLSSLGVVIFCGRLDHYLPQMSPDVDHRMLLGIPVFLCGLLGSLWSVVILLSAYLVQLSMPVDELIAVFGAPESLASTARPKGRRASDLYTQSSGRAVRWPLSASRWHKFELAQWGPKGRKEAKAWKGFLTHESLAFVLGGICVPSLRISMGWVPGTTIGLVVFSLQWGCNLFFLVLLYRAYLVLKVRARYALGCKETPVVMAYMCPRTGERSVFYQRLWLDVKIRQVTSSPDGVTVEMSAIGCNSVGLIHRMVVRIPLDAEAVNMIPQDWLRKKTERDPRRLRPEASKGSILA